MKDLLIQKEGHIGWLIINRPALKNAFNLNMWKSLPKLLATLENDPEVRVIVLRGSGDEAFASGADISEFKKFRTGTQGGKLYTKAVNKAYKSVRKVKIPTIAMIHGFCFGGGLAVALSCDIRLADQNGKFAIPAAKLSIAYSYNEIKQLVDLVGVAHAKEILFSARMLKADEAEKLGLVNHVYAKSDLQQQCLKLVGKMAENAPLSIKAAKSFISMVQFTNKKNRTIDEMQKLCLDSSDYTEGINAFLDKRKPNFTGN